LSVDNGGKRGEVLVPRVKGEEAPVHRDRTDEKREPIGEGAKDVDGYGEPEGSSDGGRGNQGEKKAHVSVIGVREL